MRYLFKIRRYVYNSSETDWRQYKNCSPQPQQKDVEVLQDGEFFEHVLSRIAKIIKTNI